MNKKIAEIVAKQHPDPEKDWNRKFVLVGKILLIALIGFMIFLNYRFNQNTNTEKSKSSRQSELEK